MGCQLLWLFCFDVLNFTFSRHNNKPHIIADFFSFLLLSCSASIPASLQAKGTKSTSFLTRKERSGVPLACEDGNAYLTGDS